MSKLRNWLVLCALLFSLQAYGNEISIQDAWIRTHASGQENAIVGMVITSTRDARIVGVISPGYKFVALQGPGKSGANKTQEIEFIDLPAQKAVVLDAESVHMLLLGNRHTLGAADNVPVIFTVQFDDKTRKIITVMVQFERSDSAATKPANSNVTSQASTVVPPIVPLNPVDLSSKDAATSVTPSTKLAPSKAKPSQAKPVVAAKPQVAEVVPLKVAPVTVLKPKDEPISAPIPVVDVAPSVAPLIVEPKKAPDAKPVEQPKQVEARTTDACLALAHELRECGRLNDMMVAWCETEAKSKYACQLTMEQLRHR